MPLEYKTGDVLNSGEKYIVHGCNCFNTMGSGIAKQVKEQYPTAWFVDQMTVAGDKNKLGTFTYVAGSTGTIIINAYTQYRYSRTQVAVDYDAVRSALTKICETFTETPLLAMPKIGAGLGGGDWAIIEQILLEVSNKYNKTFRVYTLPTAT